MHNVQLVDAWVAGKLLTSYLKENITFSDITDYHSKIEDLSLPYYLSIVKEDEKKWRQELSSKVKYKQPHPEFEIGPRISSFINFHLLSGSK